MPNLDTIDYDEPVQNLIAGLNATGHITHGPYRKTMVTIHHNGGIFTAQQVLNIWKTRPASAHFDVERDGSVTQFANCYDYTWACADRHGNETSISIEMSNATTSPDWLVNIDTWRSAARLTGWLHANILHGTPRPSRSTVVPHHHWAATSCAGPYMDSVWGEFIDACQAAYDMFRDGKTPPKHHKPKPPKKVQKLDVDGSLGEHTIMATQRATGTTVDGYLSEPSQCVAQIQTYLNKRGHRDKHGHRLKVDGLGIQSNWAQDYGPTHTIEALQGFYGTTVDGYLSEGDSLCVRALQEYLNAGHDFK